MSHSTLEFLLSVLTVITGIIGITLCSRKKLYWFYFGFIQTISYAIVCYMSNLTYNTLLQIVIFSILIFGYFSWKKNSQSNEVQVKELSLVIRISLIIGLGLTLFIGTSLKSSLDIFSTIAVLIAQILMALRYRDQWLFYIIADGALLPIWLLEHNYLIFLEYLYFFINAIYGYHKWKQPKCCPGIS